MPWKKSGGPFAPGCDRGIRIPVQPRLSHDPVAVGDHQRLELLIHGLRVGCGCAVERRIENQVFLNV
jgi:hypothetical protein